MGNSSVSRFAAFILSPVDALVGVNMITGGRGGGIK